MEIRFRKLHPDAVIPFHGTKQAGGYDLTAVEMAWDEEDKLLVYHTGLAVEIPDGYAGSLRPRSSICKKTLLMVDAPATIDADYRGEITVKFTFRWAGEDVKPRFYALGERIAELVIQPVITDVTWCESETLSETERGEGAYGSTGA